MNKVETITLAIGDIGGIDDSRTVGFNVLSVVNFANLTATEPDSPAAGPQRITAIGLYCGYMLLVPHVYVWCWYVVCVFPHQIDNPIKG